MKQVKYLMAATALSVLAGCTSESETTEPAQAPVGVTFGAYQAQSTKTRGEINGVEDFAKEGFGVFAYYTNTEDYAGTTTPNFMYNQQVTGATTDNQTYSWSYSPLKYWPNDIATGDIDGKGATGSVAGGKVSFFAYAPYNADASIFSAASATGNPTVKYTIADTNPTDLLWGTVGNNTVHRINDAGEQKGDKVGNGLAPVWVNITRPQPSELIKFNFRHALAKFGGSSSSSGGVKIVLKADNTDANSKTKVTVRNIQIAYANEKDQNSTFAKTGTLDLATGLWSGIDNTLTFSYNLTRDASNSGETKLNPAIAETTNSAGEVLVGKGADYTSAEDFFNNDTYNNGTHPGVTATAVDVFASSVAPFFFVPGTKPQVKVTVSYVVRTYDANLATQYTEVEQTVSKTVTFKQTELNKAYGLLIQLGLTSLKFDVTEKVTNWEDVEGSPANGTQIDLPAIQ